MDRGQDTPWLGVSKYHGYGYLYNMERRHDIPCHGELDISWVGGQKYQGYEVLNTMDRGFDLPWVGGLKIP
jgi:hypothetical protein